MVPLHTYMIMVATSGVCGRHILCIYIYLYYMYMVGASKKIYTCSNANSRSLKSLHSHFTSVLHTTWIWASNMCWQVYCIFQMSSHNSLYQVSHYCIFADATSAKILIIQISWQECIVPKCAVSINCWRSYNYINAAYCIEYWKSRCSI